MVTCPKCSKPLGEIGPDGVLEAVCGTCSFKFQVLRGRLAGGSSREVTLREGTLSNPGSYKREYELRVERPNGRLETFELAIPGRDDSIDVQHGDTVAIVHSMRGNAREELLDVYDLTTGRRFPIATPGSRARMMAGVAGGFVGILTFAALAATSLNEGWAIVGGVGALATTWILLARRLAPVHRLSPAEQEALKDNQQLLARKTQLLSLRTKARADLEQHSATRDQLVSLRNKMREVDSAIYKDRIDTVGRGIATLDEQMRLDRQIIEGYGKSVAMIEIEYEAGLASGAMPADAGAVLEGKLAELKELQERQAELQRLLSANSEVEAFLRNPAG